MVNQTDSQNFGTESETAPAVAVNKATSRIQHTWQHHSLLHAYRSRIADNTPRPPTSSFAVHPCPLRRIRTPSQGDTAASLGTITASASMDIDAGCILDKGEHNEAPVQTSKLGESPSSWPSADLIAISARIKPLIYSTGTISLEIPLIQARVVHGDLRAELFALQSMSLLFRPTAGSVACEALEPGTFYLHNGQGQRAEGLCASRTFGVSFNERTRLGITSAGFMYMPSEGVLSRSEGSAGIPDSFELEVEVCFGPMTELSGDHLHRCQMKLKVESDWMIALQLGKKAHATGSSEQGTLSLMSNGRDGLEAHVVYSTEGL